MKPRKPDAFANRPPAKPADDSQSAFADMLSSLPDAESMPPGPSGTGVDLPGSLETFAEMLLKLPDAEQETVGRASFHSRDSQGPSVVELRPSLPTGRPVRSGAPSRSPAAAAPDETVDSQELVRQIMDQLERHKLASASQLRIEVHGGVVVVAGEVPGPYEKQLVSHFCRQLPGVTRFVDAMVVRRPGAADETPRVPARRTRRLSREWSLPFRARHVGIALGLAVIAWGAISLARGRSGPERLTVYPLAGELRFQGQPAAGAAIVLYPQDATISVRPKASVKADGTFVVTTYEPGDGAPAGTYKATVEWRRPVEGRSDGDDAPPSPNVLPAAYASSKNTPVIVTVEDDDNEFPEITFQN